MTRAGNVVLDDPLDDMLGYQLRRLALATMTDLAAAFDKCDLKRVEGVTLRLIGANPGCNQGEISRALGVQRTNLVPVVSALVTRGLVRREKANGRTHALHLTESGRAVQVGLAIACDTNEQMLFGDVSADEKARLLAFCRSRRTVANQ